MGWEGGVIQRGGPGGGPRLRPAVQAHAAVQAGAPPHGQPPPRPPPHLAAAPPPPAGGKREAMDALLPPPPSPPPLLLPPRALGALSLAASAPADAASPLPLCPRLGRALGEQPLGRAPFRPLPPLRRPQLCRCRRRPPAAPGARRSKVIASKFSGLNAMLAARAGMCIFPAPLLQTNSASCSCNMLCMLPARLAPGPASVPKVRERGLRRGHRGSAIEVLASGREPGLHRSATSNPPSIRPNDSRPTQEQE